MEDIERIPKDADLKKVCELIALDDGYALTQNTITLSPDRTSVHCWIQAQGEYPIQARYSAAQVNRKLARTSQVSKQQETDMAIDYKARALKSAATRKANKAAKSAPVVSKAAKIKNAAAITKSAAKSAPKAEKTLNACLCGCGTMVKGQFAQGHDAKLHGIVARAVKAQKKLDAAVRKLAATYIANRWPDEAKEVL